MTLKSILHQHRSDLALIVGNGINRYGSAPKTNSWKELLSTLERKRLGADTQGFPEGISLTEVYDILELKSGPIKAGSSLQREFCDLIRGWVPHDHHKRIVSWAQRAQCPLLTTNFERILAEAGGCKLFHTPRNAHTDYYPWEAYYGNVQLSHPESGFGIWHINGMETYQRSIRLGLTHYMGSVQRARNWIHRGKSKSLFSGQNVKNWNGAGTWVDTIFHKSLFIFGIGLDQNEVFLRWLLIERAKYFQKFPERSKRAWYVFVNQNDDVGRSFFLKGVGVEPVQVSNYDEIYGSGTWI